MTPTDPTLSAPGAAPAAADLDARALIGGQLAMLTRLAQIGMEIAEAAGAEARAAAATAAAAPEVGAAPARDPRRDPGLTFARVSRAVRMTIALQSRLLKDLADLDRAEARAADDRKRERRLRLVRLVGQAVEEAVAARGDAGAPARDADPDEDWDEDAFEDEVEQLTSEACERLRDAEDDLSDRPVHEVMAGICGDLGLSPDWTARLMAAVAAPLVAAPLAAGGAGDEAPAAPRPRPRPVAAPPDPELSRVRPPIRYVWLDAARPSDEPPPDPPDDPPDARAWAPP